MNLLAQLKGHLRKQDFSALTIRQAYLQGIEAQDANFAGARLFETVFMEPIESIASMALSPDGVYLAVGSFSGQIRVWHLAERKVLLTWQGHIRMIWAVAFSPDNRLLASGDDDGTLALWDVEMGTCRQVVRADRPYERMNIHGVKGITPAQRSSLKTLGAIEEDL